MTVDFSLPPDPASAWAAAPDHQLVTPRVRDLLAQVFDVDPDAATPAPPTVPGVSRLADDARDALVAAVGAEHVRLDAGPRAAHANGMSYLDLLRRRIGQAPDAPDAVVFPADADEVAAVLAACVQFDVAVVPFGGGTSVVGGVRPERGPFAAVVAVDLARFDRLVELDEVSRTATLQAGLSGPRADELLKAHGYTLGHVPQSFERATIGGYAATRSAGQLSTGWGRFDALVEHLRAVTPAGVLDLGRAPGTAAGPDLRQLLLGSEGAFGVITEVTVRVRPVPETRRHEGWRVASFADGVALVRALGQDGPRPDLLRLSDETETALGAATSGEEAGDGCLVLIGWEGAAEDVARRADAATALFRARGATPLGEDAAASWRQGRFRAPRLRDELLGAGLLVETLETAVRWRDLEALHATVGERLRAALDGARPVVACHLSHVYPAGASLYFSVLARQDARDPVAQWETAKSAASDALADAGATITHHHAVGTDHAPWMTAEVGDAGVAVLRAVKAHLDPHGVMNPGKLIPGRTDTGLREA
ncbi:MAG: FAD-binding oxidoreductase [Solirubrobacteraceae bacterium]